MDIRTKLLPKKIQKLCSSIRQDFHRFYTCYVYRNKKCNKNKKQPKIRTLNIFVFMTYPILSGYSITPSIVKQIFRSQLFTQS